MRWEDDPGSSLAWEKLKAAMASFTEPDDIARELGPFVDELLAEKALLIDEDSLERLRVALRDAIRDAAETLGRRAHADYGPDRIVERFPEWEDRLPGHVSLEKRDAKANASSTSLTALLDGWAAERKPRPQTVAQTERVVALFKKFVRHDDAAKVTADDVVAWKDALVERANLTAKTINARYLTPLGTIFNWGVANRRVGSNPTKGIRSLGKAAPRVRDRSFTDAEVKLILNAAIAAPETQGRHSPEMLAARRWVPWLCAYSGARVTEITQLRAQDFREEKGVWVFVITPEAGAVKTDKPRMVPVHSDLIRQALLEFVRSKGEGPLFYAEERRSHRRIAPMRIGGKRSEAAPPAPTHPARTVAGRLSGWVRDIGVKDPNVQPNHAWRHLFMTLCRAHGVAEEARYFLVGHTLRDMGQRYGEAEPGYLSRELDKIPAFSPR